MKNLIKNGSKITSIITQGYKRNYLTPNLIEQFSNKRILLWQRHSEYFPCKRFELYYGVDLKECIKEQINDFDVLIINSFVEWCNSKETIEFVKFLYEMEEMDNKQVILIFSCKYVENKKSQSLKDFKNYNGVIKEVSNQIYSFKEGKVFGEYLMEDYSTGEVTAWQSYYENGVGKLKSLSEECF